MFSADSLVWTITLYIRTQSRLRIWHSATHTSPSAMHPALITVMPLPTQFIALLFSRMTSLRKNVRVVWGTEEHGEATSDPGQSSKKNMFEVEEEAEEEEEKKEGNREGGGERGGGSGERGGGGREVRKIEEIGKI